MKGKPGVEKAFKEYGCKYDGKPAIYLVDGDFDLVMGKKMIENPNYIYLEKYNIESYYIDEMAVLRFMTGKMKKTKKSVSQIVKYSSWENMVYKAMKELFINYMIAQSTFPNEKSVGLSEHSFFYQNGYANYDKINEYIDTLKKRIPNYEEIYSIYNKRFEEVLLGDITRLVCGKYLLASLSSYLRNIDKVKFKEEDFVNFLISTFNIKKLDFVKERIVKIMMKKQVLAKSEVAQKS